MSKKTNKARFADMPDDLSDIYLDDLAERGALGAYADIHADQLERIARNRRKNANRKYKPQKGRMKLLMCMKCEWKCRTTQAMIEAGIPGCPRPSCSDYQKPLEKVE